MPIGACSPVRMFALSPVAFYAAFWIAFLARLFARLRHQDQTRLTCSNSNESPAEGYFVLVSSLSYIVFSAANLHKDHLSATREDATAMVFRQRDLQPGDQDHDHSNLASIGAFSVGENTVDLDINTSMVLAILESEIGADLMPGIKCWSSLTIQHKTVLERICKVTLQK